MDQTWIEMGRSLRPGWLVLNPFFISHRPPAFPSAPLLFPLARGSALSSVTIYDDCWAAFALYLSTSPLYCSKKRNSSVVCGCSRSQAGSCRR